MNCHQTKRKILSLALALCIALSALLISTFTALAALGSPVTPMQIGTEEELRAFAIRVNAGETDLCATLTADIEIGSSAWTPIGTSETAAYAGVFDGNGHTVSGMSINATTGYQGFFGAVNGASAKILNLTVSGSITVTSTSDISAFGGIVAGRTAAQLSQAVKAVLISPWTAHRL